MHGIPIPDGNMETCRQGYTERISIWDGYNREGYLVFFVDELVPDENAAIEGWQTSAAQRT